MTSRSLLLVALLTAASRVFAAEPPPNAAPEVTIDLFSDFQCPFCAGLAQPMHDLQSKGVEGVRLAVNFKHFPLTNHADAPLAHRAALAAQHQGKFWEMHNLLFANQLALKRQDLLGYARKVGLDVDRFSKDLDDDAAKRVIESDTAEGGKRGVTGTPTFFVNGKQYVGAKSFEELKKLVQDEQRRAVALSEITDNLMSKGPASAPVTLEFYADLQSPVSRPAMAVLEELMRAHPQSVRLQFRNFPLAFHPQAALAHDAAMTAARQGRFWEFAEYILDHQDSLREQDLIAFAGKLGLDESGFAATIQQRRYTPRVEADLMNGLRRGIRGSPVIFVNGQRIDGVPSLETLTQHVQAEAAAKK